MKKQIFKLFNGKLFYTFVCFYSLDKCKTIYGYKTGIKYNKNTPTCAVGNVYGSLPPPRIQGEKIQALGVYTYPFSIHKRDTLSFIGFVAVMYRKKYLVWQQDYVKYLWERGL